ncbi:MAG: acyl-CoA dehydrogenase [Deltaproteobacteria bacterium]|nr:MAG: acyl-CoA dehydrogenase [Deltaproteobacteria bacterium]
MKTTEQFLSNLRNLGVNLRTEGNELRCQAPKGALTSDLRTELAERKSEILSFLQKAASCKQGASFQDSAGILQYSEDQQEFRERLRTFLKKEVTPCADQWEKEGIVPKSVWKKMGQEGFLCTGVSSEYGGLGGDFRYSVIVAEEMSRTNHTGLALTLHSDIVVPYIEDYASEELKRKYLPGCVSGEIVTAVAITEPGAGSDIFGISTSADEQGETVIINGSKTLISNGINADLVVLAAQNPYAEEKSLSLSLYLVEAGTPGFEKGDRLKKMGMHSQDTAELFFSDCRIPKANRLGEKGAGFCMLMEKLQQERLTCVITAVAMAERILETTLAHLKQEVPVSGGSLSNSQAVRFAIAEMATEIRLGRAFLEKLVIDHAEKRNVVTEISMAKYWTAEMAKRVADRCLDIFGNTGILEECPIVRTWRDVRAIPIFAGTSEIMKNIIAESILSFKS